MLSPGLTNRFLGTCCGVIDLLERVRYLALQIAICSYEKQERVPQPPLQIVFYLSLKIIFVVVINEL